ncbi:hypothetical protein [Dolichospermum circinale]|nr:hypothetical protein [Dolichospermum circinale]MDB9450754.1 hypothetical protein [Dolichospermum circinale CS-547]
MWDTFKTFQTPSKAIALLSSKPFYRKVRSLLPNPTTPTPASAILGHPN